MARLLTSAEELLRTSSGSLFREMARLLLRLFRSTLHASLAKLVRIFHSTAAPSTHIHEPESVLKRFIIPHFTADPCTSPPLIIAQDCCCSSSPPRITSFSAPPKSEGAATHKEVSRGQMSRLAEAAW